MRAEQEVAGGVGGGEEVPVVDDEGLDDEDDALEVGGELAEVADAVGTELGVPDAGAVTVGVPETVGAGLEHAPIRPATAPSASTVAAAGSAGRPVGRSLWLTV